MTQYRAYGKLLLSAEYMVMYGSEALALPLTKGQSLSVSQSKDPGVLSWTAKAGEYVWFKARLHPGSLRVLESSDNEIAERLKYLLEACIELRSEFQQDLFHREVNTNLDFSPDYGFGSSSTLIALVADWAGVNPLDLHFMVSDGSGYDVACALANGPILYKLKNQSPHYRHVPFQPSFSDQLWFAWLGKKQSTAAHLEEISGKFHPNFEQIRLFSQLTHEIMDATTLDSFRDLIERHETELAKILKTKPVSEHFRELPLSVKSLGAWGGDFILIATELDKETLSGYLEQKGIEVVYSYKELVYEGN